MSYDTHEVFRSEVSRQAAIDKFRNRPENETGWDRLKEMYTMKHIQYAEFDSSPELAIVGSGLKTSAIVGFLTGYFNHWKPSRETFMRLNRETKFLGQSDFMRNMYLYQIKASVRRGLMFGTRLGLFTGLYCLGTTSIAMYNNELGVKEFGFSGLLAGGLWQAKVGLGGVVTGGTVGGLLGLLTGFASVKLMEFYGEDLATLRYQLHFEKLQAWEQRERLQAEWLMKEMLDEAKSDIKSGKRIV